LLGKYDPRTTQVGVQHFPDGGTYYFHHVIFTREVTGANIGLGFATTEGTLTTISESNMKFIAEARQKEIDWPSYYANTSAHEVLWAGLLGRADDILFGDPLGANETSSHQLLTITPEMVRLLEESLRRD
jgi:hypothetical protein